jgi:hypothetical protein
MTINSFNRSPILIIHGFFLLVFSLQPNSLAFQEIVAGGRKSYIRIFPSCIS